MANFSVYKSAAAIGAASAVGAVGAAQAQSVETGMYGGLSYSTPTSGEFDVYDGEAFGGHNLGGFVGFNFVQGATVIGLEIALSQGFEIDDNIPFSPETLADIRFRFGQQFGDFLVYLTAGGSTFYTDYDGDNYTGHGPSFGGGVEYSVMENAFLGLDVNARSLVEGSGKFDERPLVDAAVRIGFRW